MITGGVMIGDRKTVQVGLRIEKDLLKRIEALAEIEAIDKMSFIKQALASFVQDAEDETQQSLIRDYIKLIIDEKELKRLAKLEEIPSDIKEARKEFLRNVTKGAKREGTVCR